MGGGTRFKGWRGGGKRMIETIVDISVKKRTKIVLLTKLDLICNRLCFEPKSIETRKPGSCVTLYPI